MRRGKANSSKEEVVGQDKMNVLFDKVWNAEFSNGKIASLDVKTRKCNFGLIETSLMKNYNDQE